MRSRIRHHPFSDLKRDARGIKDFVGLGFRGVEKGFGVGSGFDLIWRAHADRVADLGDVELGMNGRFVLAEEIVERKASIGNYLKETNINGEQEQWPEDACVVEFNEEQPLRWWQKIGRYVPLHDRWFW